VKEDPEVLKAALIGYQHQIDQIKQAMADLQHRLGKSGSVAAPAANPGRRRLSAATKKRMAAGQKKRWAAYRQQKAGS